MPLGLKPGKVWSKAMNQSQDNCLYGQSSFDLRVTGRGFGNRREEEGIRGPLVQQFVKKEEERFRSEATKIEE